MKSLLKNDGRWNSEPKPVTAIKPGSKFGDSYKINGQYDVSVHFDVKGNTSILSEARKGNGWAGF